MAYTLQLLHLSDGEAGLLAPDTAPNLAALVDAFDDDFANTLILSGGDTFLPGPFLAAGTDLSVTAALNAVSGSTIGPTANIPIGAVDMAIHNAIGVEVSSIGNHEFDLGSRTFRDSFSPNLGAAGWVGADFVHISANLDFSGDSDLNPRFTDTVDGPADPTATLVPEASTLKGRIAPAVVITEGGEKIGFVGATTQILESISSPSGTEVKGFPTGLGPNGEVDDMVLLAQQLQPIIDELIAEGVNKIVLHAHLQQIDNEIELASLLHGVDIILSAGSNTRLGDADDEAVAFPGHAADFADTYPIPVTDLDGNTTLIINTDNEYTYMGRLVVDFDDDGNVILDSLTANQSINGAYASTDENVAEAWGTTVDNLETTAFADGTKGDKVRDLTDAVDAVIQVKDGNVFGFTDVYLEGERGIIRNQETNLGDLTADANGAAAREALGDIPLLVSLKNAGGIRAQIGTLGAPDPVDGSVDKLPPPANPEAGKPEGGVSQLDIENSLRFNNKLMVFDTTVQGLLNILNWGAGLSANNGGFPQIGGIKFSFDPTLPGNSTVPGSNPPIPVIGSRVRDVALVDEDGKIITLLVDDGVILPGVPDTITVATINFTANGGDGYPIKANATNFRYILDDGTLSAPVDPSLDFTLPANVPANALGEQQALAEYMTDVHGTEATAYNQADTPISEDIRIQNLSFRGDTVFDSVPIVGTEGDDLLAGTPGNEGMDGLGGNDQLTAGNGNDTLIGGTGNDTLDGGGGVNTLRGGAGDDTYVVAGDTDTVDETADGSDGIDTVLAAIAYSLGATLENLTLTGAALTGSGNELANTIIGNDADNTLEGLAGDDALDGGGGNDTMLGGIGNDAYVVDSLSDVVTEAADAGTDLVRSTVSLTLGDNVERLELQGAAAIDGAGNALENRLTGNAAANMLSGLGDKDRLDGGLGNDILTGGGANDRFLFTTGLSGESNVDHITEFKRGDDKIALDAGIFAEIGSSIGSGEIRIGGKSGDKNDHIVYKKSTGELFYDPNGKGDGNAVLFAVLDNEPNKLGASDFLVMT